MKEKILKTIFAFVLIMICWLIIATILLNVADYFGIKWINNKTVSLAGVIFSMDWGQTVNKYIWGE